MVAVISWSDNTTVAKVLRLWYSNLNKINLIYLKHENWSPTTLDWLTCLSLYQRSTPNTPPCFLPPKITQRSQLARVETQLRSQVLSPTKKESGNDSELTSQSRFQANTQIAFKLQARSPFEGVMRNYTKAACKRRFECEGSCSLLWLAFPGGRNSIYPWVGRWSEAPHTLTLFKTNIADFPTLFKTEFRFLIPCLRH